MIAQKDCETPEQTCPTCGRPFVLPLSPYDPVVSALLDHLLVIEGELADVKRLIEEVAS